MAGLENYLSALKDNAGMAGGFNQGLRDRTTQDTALAGLAQRQAETQRYTGETPSFLRRGEATARSAELANLQPEAEAALGVPNAKAKVSLEEANLTAEKAVEAKRQLGPQKTLQMIKEIEQQSTATIGVMRQYLSQYPTADQAIAAFRQSHPQLTQDSGFNAEVAKYRGKPSAQALQELETSAAAIAKGIAAAKAETQAEMMKLQAQGQNQKDVAHIQGGYSLQGDRIRAAASAAGSGKESAAQLVGNLAGQAADAYAAGDKALGDKLIYQINAINKARPDEPGFAGIPGSPGNQVKPYGESSSPAAQGGCLPGYTKDSRGVCIKSK